MKYRLLIILTPAILLLDYITKGIARDQYAFHSKSLISGYINLIYRENGGLIWEKLSDLPSPWGTLIFTLMGIILISLILYLFYKLPDNLYLLQFSIIFILAGALGNTITHLQYGTVIDFIDIHSSQTHYPPFNLADISLILGTILFLIDWLLSLKQHKKDQL